MQQMVATHLAAPQENTWYELQFGTRMYNNCHTAPLLRQMYIAQRGLLPSEARAQGCIKTPDNHRRRGDAPPWTPSPSLDPDFMVGNNDIYQRKYQLSHFWHTNSFFGFQTPSPPSLY